MSDAEPFTAPEVRIPESAARAPAARGHDLGGYLLAATGAILFSMKAVIVKLAYGLHVDPETLLALRMGFSLPFYLGIGFLAVRGRRHKLAAIPSLNRTIRAALIGMLGMWVASYTDFLGLQYISAQFERLILLTYPLFVVLFGAMFFGQTVRPRALLALGVSYAGLALIFGESVSLEGHDVAIGAGWVLVAAISFGLYQLLAKNAIDEMGPKLFTCIAMTGASIAAFIQFFAHHSGAELLVSGPLLFYSVLVAIAATVLPSFFMSAALHRISAQANSTIGVLSPVSTIILAAIILGERMNWMSVFGTLLVIGGVGWFTLADRRS
ncbi:MAG TPA: DMT family transporter [Micropepsaceae bacterium]|jgi:drug/metabolite transporter (DMT)-like permease